MKKILLIITELRQAGAENIVFNLATQLSKQNFKIIVAALDGRGEIGKQLKLNNIPVYDLKGYKKSDLKSIFRLNNIIHKEKPDIIHSHLFHANIISRLANIGNSIPLISSIHIAERRNKPLHFLLDKLTSPLCKKWICVSEHVKTFHSAKTGINKDKFTVIYNGIDIEKFNCKKPKKFAQEYSKFHIGTLGRFDKQKGIDVFIKALPKIHSLLPKAKFSITGWGDEEFNLKNLINNLNLGAIVKVNGKTCHPENIYNELDFFIMPSIYEGFGLTLLEAMSCGCIPVCFKLEPLCEILGDELTSSCTANQKTTDSLAEKIIYIASNPDKCIKISELAQKRARLFSRNEMLAKHISIYESLI